MDGYGDDAKWGKLRRIEGHGERRNKGSAIGETDSQQQAEQGLGKGHKRKRARQCRQQALRGTCVCAMVSASPLKRTKLSPKRGQGGLVRLDVRADRARDSISRRASTCEGQFFGVFVGERVGAHGPGLGS